MLKWLVAACLVAGLVSGPAQAQEKSLIRITRQPSIIYMPTYVMESKHLIEAHAAKLGVPNLKVEWVNFNGGGTATDALLSNSVEVVNTGVGNMLLLWDRTRGGVKGIVATSALPLTLITRDPNIKTLRDYKPGDKIALPTVRVSTQALLLQIACEKLFGPDQASKLDANTVQLGHPDAVGAMLDPRGQITSHFSAPPFSFEELRRVPGAHVVTDTQDIMGTPLTVAALFTTTRFADANPKITEAIKEAAVEALKLIHTDTADAVAIYRAGSKDPTSDADLLAMLKEPGMMEFNPQPQGSMRFATHMHKAGLLKTEPKAWTDYFLPLAKDLGGDDVASLLEVDRCTLRYRADRTVVTATYQVSFQVGQGDRYVLLGPSGCGKSTLLKAVGGYLRPDEGEIRIKGKPVQGAGADRMMVFQEFDQLLPWKTVVENVAFPLRVARGMSARAATERAMHYVDKVHLGRAAHSFPHTLSGGMKQRVAIARGMAMEPDILLMDEPFAALDALTRRQMQDELLQLWEDTRFTVLFVTHSIGEAIRVGSRILLLSPHPGQVKAEVEEVDQAGAEDAAHLEQRIHDLLFAPATAMGTEAAGG